MMCPYCGSEIIVKNGSNSCGKQKFMCKNCRRQFVENPENKIISQKTEDIINDLLKEKISLAGIARVAKVSKRWMQNYANKKYERIPRVVKVTEKKKATDNTM